MQAAALSTKGRATMAAPKSRSSMLKVDEILIQEENFDPEITKTL